MESRRGLASSLKQLGISGDKKFLPLTNLPEAAQRVLLGKLSIWSLMDLRLASKGTCKMVDNVCLDRLVLNVATHAQMKESEFSNSRTKWSSVVIRCDGNQNDLSWIHNELYSQLLNRLSTCLTTLKLPEHRVPYIGLRSILCTCEALKSIEFSTLSCADWTGEDPNDVDNPKIVASLGKLETLIITFISWDEEENLGVIKYILSKCSRVTFFKVPHIFLATLFRSCDDDEDGPNQAYIDLIQTSLMDPLLEYISIPKTANENGPILPTFLDVENVDQPEFFARLLHACHAAGTKMLNVNEGYLAPIPEEDLECFPIIESLYQCGEHLNFHELEHLKSISFDSGTSANSIVNNDSITAPLPALESISFFVSARVAPNVMNFFKQNRPNVETLCIEFEEEEPVLSQVYPAEILAQNYSQLRNLSLIHWDGIDDNLILILNSITSLVSLTLVNCSQITDRGFLGQQPTQPILLNQTGLKHLSIECGISDAVLKYAVRLMPLESFYYSSEYVTLAGFLSLSRGSLANSLICFPVTPPPACRPDILHKFLSGFKNLKRKPVLCSIQYQVDVDVHRTN
ncbi:uncharacterized protein LOC110863546 [Folsomia candida]|nr:uncharacterized protein LOC110863546 [Folsomia candida]